MNLSVNTLVFAMDPEFMETLEKIREEVGIPFIITSAYRDPTHPIEAKKSQPGAHASEGCRHTYTRRGRLKVYRSSVKTRCNWLGVKQHGDSRFIHLDTLEATNTRPRPWVWSYE